MSTKWCDSCGKSSSPGRVLSWGCLMGVLPREGRFGEGPSPWCRGVASARDDNGPARGRGSGFGVGMVEAASVAAMSSLPMRTYAARGQPAQHQASCIYLT